MKARIVLPISAGFALLAAVFAWQISPALSGGDRSAPHGTQATGPAAEKIALQSAEDDQSNIRDDDGKASGTTFVAFTFDFDEARISAFGQGQGGAGRCLCCGKSIERNRARRPQRPERQRPAQPEPDGPAHCRRPRCLDSGGRSERENPDRQIRRPAVETRPRSRRRDHHCAEKSLTPAYFRLSARTRNNIRKFIVLGLGLMVFDWHV